MKPLWPGGSAPPGTELSGRPEQPEGNNGGNRPDQGLERPARNEPEVPAHGERNKQAGAAERPESSPAHVHDQSELDVVKAEPEPDKSEQEDSSAYVVYKPTIKRARASCRSRRIKDDGNGPDAGNHLPAKPVAFLASLNRRLGTVPDDVRTRPGTARPLRVPLPRLVKGQIALQWWCSRCRHAMQRDGWRWRAQVHCSAAAASVVGDAESKVNASRPWRR
jgi:hypothetical protein